MEPSAPSSSINSKSTAIKTILLAAWRAKLTDEEWETRIRKILPRGVNGDVYDLADCLLKQALVGPIPNQLFISYLKHAVKCELVSHGAVLSSIANQSTTHIKQTSNIPTANFTYQTAPSQQQLSILNRTSPIICLLDFLKTFRDKISCRGSEIECLKLCHSISQLLHWLLKCIQNSIQFMLTTSPTASGNTTNLNISSTGPPQGASNLNQQPVFNQQVSINLALHEPTIRIIDLCTETIHYFIDRPFMKSLLFISKIEYGKEFEEIFKIVNVIQQRIAVSPNLISLEDKLQYLSVFQQLINTFNSRDMHPSVLAAQQLRCLQQHRIRSTQIVSGSQIEGKIQQTLLIHDSTTNYALFNSLYSLIACDAILRPARSHKLLAKQISIITDFNTPPINMTYCEIIRVCMIGFIDSFGTPAKVKWAFFTFLKMPKLLIELSKLSQKTNSYESNFLEPSSATQPSSSFINDLNLAFERLCEYSPLLDEAEYKCNCDFFKCIVKELIKNEPSLTQELRSIDFKKYLNKRVSHNGVDNNNSGMGGNMLLKTEPVVTTILQTLDSSINQDPAELFSIISQLVSGKQFEFTLSAAASTGRLQLFVKKLIDHNELNKIPKSENPLKSSLIFDITFLILAYIAQQYGADVIDFDNQKQNSSSTFKKWFHDCYNPSSRIDCPKEMLKNCNPEVVSSLIKQILRTDENGGGLEMKTVDWRDVCMNLPKAISEILSAWSQGVLDDNDVKLVFEHIKSKMCFAAVVTAVWLQAHIRTLNEVDKMKPLMLLQSLTKASSQAKQQKLTTDNSNIKDHYSERSSLMCSIIRKIYFELAPKLNLQTQPNAGHTTSSINNGGISNSTTAISTSATNDNNGSSEESSPPDETSYQSINDKFISTLTAQEIFLSNVKLCLSRGWIDHKSLMSMNSLFKMIGGECWTNLIVEQILTSHESPSDLSRAVNITYGLFHLDIEACAFALLRDTIPSWLMGEKKQTLLSQPRAFALAHLAVMTIVEVYSNLKESQSNAMRKSGPTNQQAGEERRNQLSSNGIKQDSIKQGSGNSSSVPNPMDIDKMNNGAKEIKRIKLTNQDASTTTTGNFEKVQSNNQATLNDLNDRLNKLNDCISNLMRLFKEIMSDSVISQRTLFPVLFLQQTVVCTREGSTVITAHLQPEILLDIINLFSSELTFELVLAISNLSTTNSRKYAAKAMCQLAQVKDSKQQQRYSIGSTSSSSSVAPPVGLASGSGSSSANPQQQTGNLVGSTLLGGVKTIIASSTPMLIG